MPFQFGDVVDFEQNDIMPKGVYMVSGYLQKYSRIVLCINKLNGDDLDMQQKCMCLRSNDPLFEKLVYKGKINTLKPRASN